MKFSLMGEFIVQRVETNLKIAKLHWLSVNFIDNR